MIFNIRWDKPLVAGLLTPCYCQAAWTSTLRWWFWTERFVASFRLMRSAKIFVSHFSFSKQKGPRLGTEHDQSPCKPESHHVKETSDLLEVVFKRRSTSQQVGSRFLVALALFGPEQKMEWMFKQATVHVDSVCTKCLQCFFVTDGGAPRPQQPPQQPPNATVRASHGRSNSQCSPPRDFDSAFEC